MKCYVSESAQKVLQQITACNDKYDKLQLCFSYNYEQLVNSCTNGKIT